METKKIHAGFEYWILSDFFITDLIDKIIADADHFEYYKIEKTRTSRPDRIYMNQHDIGSFSEVVELFKSQYMKTALGEITGFDFTNCGARIELCKDAAGSWLEPHFDDPAKVLTLQLYLSDADSSTTLGGVKSSANANNGWMFLNTGAELHSLPPLTTDRISIIVNYVNDKWRDRSVVV